MCGRVVLKGLRGLIARRVEAGGPPGLIPRFNIAPTQDLVTIQLEAGAWTTRARRWGLIPSWAKDPAIASKTFNARAETAAEKPSFRQAFRSRRCLIPVDGFYEWTHTGKDKVPFFISNSNSEEMLLFAGLFETWKGPEDVVTTCTILTTEANAFMAELHSRMPAILAPAAWNTWLAPETPAAALQTMLTPAAAGLLQAWEVRPLQGDNPGLIEPAREGLSLPIRPLQSILFGTRDNP